jgi:hypothetical protein
MTVLLVMICISVCSAWMRSNRIALYPSNYCSPVLNEKVGFQTLGVTFNIGLHITSMYILLIDPCYSYYYYVIVTTEEMMSLCT